MRVMKGLSVTVLVGLAALTCGDDGVSPVLVETFAVTQAMNGLQERPQAVITSARGDFTAEVRDTATIAGKKDSLAVLRYDLEVTNINAATVAHIHAGGPNEAGAAMVFLFNGPTTRSGYSGLLAAGEITRASSFIAPFNLDSVLTRMRNGTAYVNVHTTANPGGEIRGQIQRN